MCPVTTFEQMTAVARDTHLSSEANGKSFLLHSMTSCVLLILSSVWSMNWYMEPCDIRESIDDATFLLEITEKNPC